MNFVVILILNIISIIRQYQCHSGVMPFNVVGSSSTGSDSSDEENSINTNESQMTVSRDSGSNPVTFQSLFPSMQQVYGQELKDPSRADVLLYKKLIFFLIVKFFKSKSIVWDFLNLVWVPGMF